MILDSHDSFSLFSAGCLIGFGFLALGVDILCRLKGDADPSHVVMQVLNFCGDNTIQLAMPLRARDVFPSAACGSAV